MENRTAEFGNAQSVDDDFLPTEPPALTPLAQSEVASAAAAPSAPVQLDGVQSAKRRSLRLPLLIAAPVVAIVAGLYIYLHGGRYESTDNAYLQAGLVSVGANVSGQVLTVAVHENQAVHKGDVLFTLDPAPFQAAVDEAAAALSDARQQVGSVRANYAQGQAEIEAARDKLAYATGEAARQKELLAEGISSRAQYDQAVLAAQTARQGIVTSQQQNASVLATLSGKADTPVDQQPTVKRMQATLDRARLNLGYTVVRASQDGVVTKVNQLQVGDYVSAAHPVFTLAGTHIWVEANFKENQLDHMRIGQPATFHVAAFPSVKLTGHVTSFSPGTGNTFALLPPENATGNWVKVVQRLPVEFEIDNLPANIPLHSGLSVDVTADTEFQRHLLGPDTPESAPASNPTAPK